MVYYKFLQNFSNMTLLSIELCILFVDKLKYKKPSILRLMHRDVIPY